MAVVFQQVAQGLSEPGFADAALTVKIDQPVLVVDQAAFGREKMLRDDHDFSFPAQQELITTNYLPVPRRRGG